MDAGEALAGLEAGRAIARAARVARTAVAIHDYDGAESGKVAGCGACAEACTFVHTLPWGPQACRRSREKHARSALKRDRPVPYLCHMGFACVAAPVSPVEDGTHIATFGPYCPAETPNSLEGDALEGLARLEQTERRELPFSLTDIPSVPVEVVPEVAEWLHETIQKQSEVSLELEENESGTHGETILKHHSLRRPGRQKPLRDPYNARAILAAMTNPDSAAFREAVASQLAAGRADREPERIRARVSALVAAVTEAAHGPGRPRGAAPTASPLDRLGAALAGITTSEEAVGVALRALAPLRRAMLHADEGSAKFFAEIERYVEERLADLLTLDAAAKHFGLPPSTLTRRLERRYGLTFTGYIARRRVERAKTLLAKSKLSVETVARRVGLTDGAHLRRLMQRFEGTTPTEAREARRKTAGTQ
jgi:AraC-like DNA-binding protein